MACRRPLAFGESEGIAGGLKEGWMGEGTESRSASTGNDKREEQTATSGGTTNLSKELQRGIGSK